MKNLYDKYMSQAKELNLFDVFNQCYYITDSAIKIYVHNQGVMTVYRYLALLDNQIIKPYYKLQYHSTLKDIQDVNKNKMTIEELFIKSNNIVYDEDFSTLQDFVRYLNSLVIKDNYYMESFKLYYKYTFVFGDNIYYKHPIKLHENGIVKKIGYEKLLFYSYIQRFTDVTIDNLIENEYNNIVENITSGMIEKFLSMHKFTYLKTEYKKAYDYVTHTYTTNEVNNIINDTFYNSIQLNYIYLNAVLRYILTDLQIKENERAQYKKIMTILIINSFDKLYMLENLIENTFNVF